MGRGAIRPAPGARRRAGRPEGRHHPHRRGTGNPGGPGRHEDDPVSTGLVASLARPGGNITGLSNMAPEVTGKQLEMIKQIVPRAALVAVLWNPANPGDTPQLRAAEAAGRTLGLRLQPLEARTSDELGGALMTYSASTPDLFRRSATCVDRILKGAKLDDLPVEQATKFDLVINLKAAKALGLTVPPSLLQRAVQVIE